VGYESGTNGCLNSAYHVFESEAFNGEARVYQKAAMHGMTEAASFRDPAFQFVSSRSFQSLRDWTLSSRNEYM